MMSDKIIWYITVLQRQIQENMYYVSLFINREKCMYAVGPSVWNSLPSDLHSLCRTCLTLLEITQNFPLLPSLGWEHLQIVIPKSCYIQALGRPSHGGNEAVIFIIANLEGENFVLPILGRKKYFCILGGKKFEHERLGDVFRGMYIFKEEEGGKVLNLMSNLEILSQ